jgi:Na+-transporting methylmalonyl-CoA/oxaloacetate decarboxylase gamma subunit
MSAQVCMAAIRWGTIGLWVLGVVGAVIVFGLVLLVVVAVALSFAVNRYDPKEKGKR